MSSKRLSRQKANMKSGKRSSRKKKTHNWTTPTVLGLILGALGLVGLIELRDQISISPLQLERANQPFSTPFRITNTGYLAIHLLKINCEDVDMKTPGLDAHNNRYGQPWGQNWENFDLERGESKTITCPNLYLPTANKANLPMKADVVITVRHRPYLLPFGSLQLCSRWVGVAADNWQWHAQPMSEIPPEFCQ
jgi:hypothetical protein